MSNNSDENEMKSLNEDSLNAVQNTLDEILIWLKIAHVDKVQNALKMALDSDEKKLVYHLSNGDTQDSIVEKASVAAGTISNYWRKWYRLGLMKRVQIKKGQYRYIRNFDLEDFSMEIPKLGAGKQSVKTTSDQKSTNKDNP